VLVGAVAVLLLVPGAPLGELPTPSGTLRADAAQVAVVDGGTLRLGDTVVRLSGVAVPARGQRCRAEDQGYDCGAAAAAALASLVRGEDLDCRLQGRDGQGFALAACSVGPNDVALSMVTDGWAHAAAGDPVLRHAEQAARAARRGIWSASGS
jgi:endonuclease YncB( thermonuclease family)